MRLLLLCSVFILATISASVQAAAVDAREVARINNCQPKKIEVYKQSVGASGNTTYKVDCTLPKTTEASTGTAPDAVLVSCSGMLCELVRPIRSAK